MRTLLKLLLLNLFLCGICYAPPLKPFRGAVLPHGRASSRGLVLYLPFNEGTGNIVSDLSGKGNSGVITGATWVGGRFGSVLSYDGNDYVTITHKPVLNLSIPFSISFWASLTTSGNLVIFEKNENSGFSVQQNPGSQTISCWVGGTGWGVATDSGIGTDLHHIVIVISATGTGGGKIYIDGIEVSTSDGTFGGPATPIYGASTPVYIGSRGGSFGHIGLIDVPTMHDYGLTAREIAELYRDSFKMSRIYWNWGVFGTISVVTDVYSGRGIGRGVGRGLVR